MSSSPSGHRGGPVHGGSISYIEHGTSLVSVSGVGANPMPPPQSRMNLRTSVFQYRRTPTEAVERERPRQSPARHRTRHSLLSVDNSISPVRARVSLSARAPRDERETSSEASPASLSASAAKTPRHSTLARLQHLLRREGEQQEQQEQEEGRWQPHLMIASSHLQSPTRQQICAPPSDLPCSSPRSSCSPPTSSTPSLPSSRGGTNATATAESVAAPSAAPDRTHLEMSLVTAGNRQGPAVREQQGLFEGFVDATHLDDRHNISCGTTAANTPPTLPPLTEGADEAAPAWVLSVLWEAEALSATLCASHGQLLREMLSRPTEYHNDGEVPASTKAEKGERQPSSAACLLHGKDSADSRDALAQLRTLELAIAREQQTLTLVERILHDTDSTVKRRMGPPSDSVKWVRSQDVSLSPTPSRAAPHVGTRPPSSPSMASSSSSRSRRSRRSVSPQDVDGYRLSRAQGGLPRAHLQSLAVKAHRRCCLLQCQLLLRQERVARQGLMQLAHASLFSLAVHFLSDPSGDDENDGGTRGRRLRLIPLGWKREQCAIERVSHWQARAEVLERQMQNLRAEATAREAQHRHQREQASADLNNEKKDHEVIADRLVVVARTAVELLESHTRRQLESCEVDARQLMASLLQMEKRKDSQRLHRQHARDVDERDRVRAAQQAQHAQWWHLTDSVHKLEESERRCLELEEEREWENTCLLTWRLFAIRRESTAYRRRRDRERAVATAAADGNAPVRTPRAGPRTGHRLLTPSPKEISPLLDKPTSEQEGSRTGTPRLAATECVPVSPPAKKPDEPRGARHNSRDSSRRRAVTGADDEDGRHRADFFPTPPRLGMRAQPRPVRRPSSPPPPAPPTLEGAAAASTATRLFPDASTDVVAPRNSPPVADDAVGAGGLYGQRLSALSENPHMTPPRPSATRQLEAREGHLSRPLQFLYTPINPLRQE